MRNQFTFHETFYEAVTALPKKEQANVILGICSYALYEEEPELVGMSKVVFDLIRLQLDAEAREEEQRESNRIRAERYRNKSRDCNCDNNGDNNGDCHKAPPSSPLETPNNPLKEIVPKGTTKKRVQKQFVPPTFEEVKAYCEQRKSPVDPKNFYDFFDAGDWVDSKGTPVIAWKQKLVTWEKYATKNTTFADNAAQAESAAPERPKSRFVSTGEFEGYWEDYIDGEWVRAK